VARKRGPGRTDAYERALPSEAVARTRYVVGVDLGTTNTALAYVDRRSGRKARSVRPFDLPQLVEPGLVKAERTLPSAVYVRGEAELADEQLALPWRAGDYTDVVGRLARVRGLGTPDRLITSAKSWLCHPGVDRHAEILPWGAPDAVPRRSPVQVEAEVLRHLQAAWDHAVAEGEADKRLDRQDLVVTVPASFDEVARELTVEAIVAAGVEALLIEEPQAALYAWISAHEDTWEETLAPGQRILVCDVGGGTTDFSLIEVTAPEDGDGAAGFERTAVGDHLLLGGDNMDLTLARRVEQRLGGKKLDLKAWHGLVQACRDAKERILEGETDKAQVAVAGRGRKLIGGTLRAEITRGEVEEVILEGFFPPVAADAPEKPKAAGLKEFGLPYESEPAITRHLRRFLAKHAGPDAGAGALAPVDHVLFNGGVFRTAALRERVLEVLGGWQERPNELTGSDLDLAVARGAAYYGLVRRGKGTRIKAGAGRSYYVEVRAAGERERKAICLIPRGLEEGALVRIADHPLELKANRPVVFPFHSATNRSDPKGSVVRLADGEFDELAPLHTVIRVGKKRTSKQKAVPVELVARYTELGTLEMYAQAKEAEKRWRLELDTRPREERPAAEAAAEGAAADAEAPPEDAGAAGVDPAALDRARKLVITTLRLPAGSAQKPLEQLGKELEEVLGGAREGWPVPVIRALFDVLLEERSARKRSPFHEARWTNLAGFCLRPGFGSTLDFDRVASMWKLYLEGMLHPNKDMVRLEWTVAWRRISGGLKRGQQETLFAPVRGVLLGQKRGANKQHMAELWRLAASLEHLSPKQKKKLGEALLELLERGKAPPRWGPWAMGRLGGRVPLYGPIDRLVPTQVAAGWLKRLLKLKLKRGEAVFAYVQLARLTGDRARDVPEDLRVQAHAHLRRIEAEPRSLRPLEEVVRAEVRDQAEFYGDSVPIGLVLKDA